MKMPLEMRLGREIAELSIVIKQLISFQTEIPLNEELLNDYKLYYCLFFKDVIINFQQKYVNCNILSRLNHTKTLISTYLKKN